MDINKIQNQGTMKDWHIALKNQEIKNHILKSEDKIEELKRIKESGLPHPFFEIFENKITREDVEGFIAKYGIPFWISICPKDELKESKRFSGLDIYTAEQVLDFVNELNINSEEYNFILLQFSKESEFKGTAIFDNDRGIFEFIPSHQHTLLARGCYTPDAAIISKGKFEKYSSNVPITAQNSILRMLWGKRGYFEFVKGNFYDRYGLFFFSIKYDDTHLNYFKI